MKILPEDRYYNDIIPLNVIYDRGERFGDDVAHIIYKDLGTGEKHVHTIHRPMIEVFIVKPEYRNYDYVKNFMHSDKCYPLKVHYATRFNEIAKEMGLPSALEAKTSPYVFGADIQLENYYMLQFIVEYPTDKEKILSLGDFDIENDIINIRRIPQYGETPINCVTYIDAEAGDVYVFVLLSNNMGQLPPDDSVFVRAEELSRKHDEDAEWLRNHVPEFIEMCHETFDESYPELSYTVLLFDDELSLIKAFWEVLKACNNDYVSAWNIPWDMINMIQRPEVLGYDPNTIIPDTEAFGKGCKVYFDEDRNPVVHRRRHKIGTYTLPTFVDDMVQYAGIRSGRSKLPSNKLNYAARVELKDEKLDYSESGSIRTFPYENFIKFILYNIKDTLLLYKLARHTKDMDTIYSRMYFSAITPNQSFTTTITVLGMLRQFILGEKYLIGPNKNKFPGAKHANIDYAKIVTGFSQNDTGDIDISDDMDELFFGENDDDDDEDGNELDAKKRKKKFSGAMIANPLHMLPTGFKVQGKDAKYIHNYVADEDIRSEYPSMILAFNISNDTLVGKVYLENPDEIEIPLYKSFNFRGDDLESYKIDKSSFMLEAYTEKDVFSFANIFLNLPEPDKVIETILDDDDIYA